MTKILLVEDDNNLREIYEARLQAEGYDIVAARDGEEALAIAVKEKPDLIISDVMMPKISGFDMLDILRSTPETKDTKVIMMTALSQAEDKDRADKLGADRYLVKSQVTLEDVAKVAKEVLAGEGSPPAETSQSSPEPAAEPEATSPSPTATTDPTSTAESVHDEPAAAPATLPEPVPADQPTTATPADPAAPTAEAPATLAVGGDNPASAPTATPTDPPTPAAPSEPVTVPGLPALYDNIPETPTPEPHPLQLDNQVPMPAAAPADPSTPAGQSGAPFLVSEPSSTPPPTPSAPPADIDESAKIAANIESFLNTKSEAVTPAPPAQAEPASEAAASDAQTPQPEPAPEVPAAESTTGKAGYKIIQPLSDMSKPTADLEAMAKKEEELGAAQTILNQSTTQPGDTPVEEPPTPPKPAGSTIDPNSLAL